MDGNASSQEITVAIASLGRPDVLERALASLHAQTRPADHLILSVTSEADLPDARLLEGVTVVMGRKSLPIQRNRAIEAMAPDQKLLIFLDDDFVPSRHFIERAERLFDAHPDIVGATGNVISDGINTAGVEIEEAERLVAEHDAGPAPEGRIVRDLYGLYGCNMVLRASAIGNRRFDERLRLYGWQEDIDFCAQLMDKGRLVKTDAFAGVHQGVKHGRAPGLKVGYSQVVNPLYLARKGTMRLGYAVKLVARNVISNHVHILRPEPWCDRLGRAKGNWIGFRDIMRGRFEPERIEQL